MKPEENVFLINDKHLGMEICFGSNFETIISWNIKGFEERSDFYILLDGPGYDSSISFPVWEQEQVLKNGLVGSFLIDFLDYDFKSLTGFEAFVSKWGIGGLIEYSATIQKIYIHGVPTINTCLLGEYIKIIWKEVKDKLHEIQLSFSKAVYYFVYNDKAHKYHGLSGEKIYFYNLQKTKSFNQYFEKYNQNLKPSFYPQINNSINNDVQYKKMSNEELITFISNNDFSFVESYHSRSVASICYIEFYKMLLLNVSVKQCKSCKKYFLVEGNQNINYCDRTVKVGKTGEIKSCKDIGPMQKYLEKTNQDPVEFEFRKAYKTKHRQLKLNKISQNDFFNWKQEAFEKKNEVLNGLITLDEFKLWIQEKRKKQPSKPKAG